MRKVRNWILKLGARALSLRRLAYGNDPCRVTLSKLRTKFWFCSGHFSTTVTSHSEFEGIWVGVGEVGSDWPVRLRSLPSNTIVIPGWVGLGGEETSSWWSTLPLELLSGPKTAYNSHTFEEQWKTYNYFVNKDKNINRQLKKFLIAATYINSWNV